MNAASRQRTKTRPAGARSGQTRRGPANSEDITRFTAIDHTQEPDFFRRFLDEGNKNPHIVSSKPIILSGLRLTGGERDLDLGCGLGDDTSRSRERSAAEVERSGLT